MLFIWQCFKMLAYSAINFAYAFVYIFFMRLFQSLGILFRSIYKQKQQVQQSIDKNSKEYKHFSYRQGFVKIIPEQSQDSYQHFSYRQGFITIKPEKKKNDNTTL